MSEFSTQYLPGQKREQLEVPIEALDDKGILHIPAPLPGMTVNITDGDGHAVIRLENTEFYKSTGAPKAAHTVLDLTVSGHRPSALRIGDAPVFQDPETGMMTVRPDVDTEALVKFKPYKEQ